MIMEFRAYAGDSATHVCDVHRGAGDNSPLQMISAQELDRYRRLEVELATLRQALAGLLAGASLG